MTLEEFMQSIEQRTGASASPSAGEHPEANSIGGYPVIRDGGEVSNMPDPRTAKDQFAEWFKKRSASDPFTGPGDWKPIR